MLFADSYDFFTSEEEVPFGDGYGYISYYYQEVKSGITVVTDNDDNIQKWDGYGFYDYELSEIKTLEGLKTFISEHLNEIDNQETEDRIEELIEIIDNNIEKQAA